MPVLGCDEKFAGYGGIAAPVNVRLEALRSAAEEHAISAPNHQLIRAERFVGKAEARAEIVRIVAKGACVKSEGGQLRIGVLHGRFSQQRQIVTKPQVKCESCCRVEFVLGVEAEFGEVGLGAEARRGGARERLNK